MTNIQDPEKGYQIPKFLDILGGGSLGTEARCVGDDMIVRLHDVRPNLEMKRVNELAEHACASESAGIADAPVRDADFQNTLRSHLSSRERIIVVGPRLGGWRKRALDVFGALVGLVLTAPLLLAVAIAIKLQDGGPIFYGHTRVGYGKRTFKCWKFRTMCVDAEARLKDLLANDAAAALEWSTRRKLTKDPRVTKMGHWLRLASIDELPQFFNILCGEMSLVGPRPLTLCELDEMEVGKKEYLSAVPGLSGLWQVSGRSDTSRLDRAELDRRYVKTWSLVNDVWIILKTVPAVLLRRGAY